MRSSLGGPRRCTESRLAIGALCSTTSTALAAAAPAYAPSCATSCPSCGPRPSHALERHFSINCDMFNDQSHGASCDWDLVLKAVGAKSMWILMVVGVDYAPWPPERRGPPPPTDEGVLGAHVQREPPF